MTGIHRLADLLSRSDSCVVLTGAGCSTESGIPDYRGPSGEWKRHKPMLFDEFRRSERNRRRYWARNFAGWPRVRDARPNAAHRAIAELEETGSIAHLITQNVDGLHFAAGSRNVVELHGNANRVVCLGCGDRFARIEMQQILADANPHWDPGVVRHAPDADAAVEDEKIEDFVVPACSHCGADLKPDVVFFGESVPKRDVELASNLVSDSDLLLVVGSSLMVWSGFRFVRQAHAAGIDVAIVNIGATRGDELASVRLAENCTEALPALAAFVDPSRIPA